jgi:hypothetical protein
VLVRGGWLISLPILFALAASAYIVGTGRR